MRDGGCEHKYQGLGEHSAFLHVASFEAGKLNRGLFDKVTRQSLSQDRVVI
jgi:hypothetical protein